MEWLVSDMEKRLEAELTEIGKEGEAVLRYERSIQAVQGCVGELRAFVRDHPFATKSEEVRYFKEMAPRIYGRLFYYQNVYQMELYRQYSSPDTMIKIMYQESGSFSLFFQRYAEFIQYYFAKETYRDGELFMRGGRMTWKNYEVGAVIDDDFCMGAYLASRIIANKLYRDWLDKSLEKLEHPGMEGGGGRKASGLKWVGSKTDLVELIYGLHLAGSFGEVTLKRVVDEVQDWLGIDLGNVSITWQEISRRKKVRTKYLDEVRGRLAKKLEAMD